MCYGAAARSMAIAAWGGLHRSACAHSGLMLRPALTAAIDPERPRRAAIQASDGLFDGGLAIAAAGRSVTGTSQRRSGMRWLCS